MKKNKKVNEEKNVLGANVLVLNIELITRCYQKQFERIDLKL